MAASLASCPLVMGTRSVAAIAVEVSSSVRSFLKEGGYCNCAKHSKCRLTHRRPLCGPHTRSIVLLITPPEDSEEAENQKMSMYLLGAVTLVR